MTTHGNPKIHESVVFLCSVGQGPVVIFDGAKIGPHCIIEEGVTIGKGAVIYSNVRLDKFCEIGERTFIGHGTILRERTIVGSDSVVAHLICCEGETTIGHDTVVHDQSHVTKGAKIGDYSFLGPMSMGINDRKIVHRRPERETWKPEAYQVGDWAKVGAGAIILPRVKVGNYAQVAAGAVVTKDVPDEALVVGCPAKIMEK